MAGTIIGIPSSAHVCQGRPSANYYPAKTQWKCDDCPQVWVVVTGVQYNEPYNAWRKLTPKTVNGREAL